jgi:cell division protein FtsQ
LREEDMMTKKQIEDINNMFNMSNNIDINQKEKEEKKKKKEREKRIKQNKEKIQQMNQFDSDTETVIKMTNRNNKKLKQEKNIKMTKKQRQIQKRKKRIKTILKWTSILALIIGGFLFALTSPIFNIKEIEVTNNKLISEETIISLSELLVGDNIFRYNSKKVSENIKENAYIESVKIKRSLPNKIQIEIQERERDYNIEFLNGYAYINKQGYVLEISDEKLELPIIQGISTPEDQIAEGNRLNSEDLEKLEDVIQIVNICKNYELDSKITSIDITNKNEYSIYMEEENKIVYLGDNTNLSTKMLYVQAILEKNQGKEGYIYVNGDLNNNFKPRFREKV